MDEKTYLERCEGIESEFAKFDSALHEFSGLYSFRFENKCGPSRGRALVKKDGQMKRMLCLELVPHISEVDMNNLVVDFGYGCWLYEEVFGRFPSWHYGKSLFEGNIGELKTKFREFGEVLMKELATITPTDIKKLGKYWEGPIHE